jgi:hypothetical protein
MSSFNPRRFVNPDTLSRVAPANLLQLLTSTASAYFATPLTPGGPPRLDLSKPLDFKDLTRLLLTADDADYPGGFRKRLERRDWIEFKPNKGYRWVYQTRDKGSSRWNNPKPSTYSDWAAGLYLDEKGHIQWLSLGTFSDAPAFLRFIEMFPKMDKEQRLNLMGVTAAMVSRRQANVLMLKQGRTGWTINNVPVPVKPGDVERAEEELAGWEKVLTKLNNLKG